MKHLRALWNFGESPGRNFPRELGISYVKLVSKYNLCVAISRLFFVEMGLLIKTCIKVFY